MAVGHTRAGGIWRTMSKDALAYSGSSRSSLYQERSCRSPVAISSVVFERCANDS